ncbi:hypothetical protein QJS66_10140 [Kocuria rhizophila]|nr:hypothetical protein QJS66_10140 [Kocuria rhizophila]
MKIQTRAPAPGPREDGVQYLVALDVDGTPWTTTATCPAASRMPRAPWRCRDDAAISTGRSWGATLPVIRQGHIESGFAVCSNGGVTLRRHRPAGALRGHGPRELRPRQRPEGTGAASFPPPKFALEGRTGGLDLTERFQDAPRHRGRGRGHPRARRDPAVRLVG